MIDCAAFHPVSAIFHACNGGTKIANINNKLFVKKIADINNKLFVISKKSVLLNCQKYLPCQYGSALVFIFVLNDFKVNNFFPYSPYTMQHMGTVTS